MNHRLHLRRCHACHHVCEAAPGQLIKNCSVCSKELIPFFYFDESWAIGVKTEMEMAEEYKSSALPWRDYPPILGLTVYWDS